MRLLVALLMLVGLAGAGAFTLARSFHAFDAPPPRHEGRCDPIVGVPGPEDIARAPGARSVYVSSTDRRDPGARGAIYRFDIDDPLGAGAFVDLTGGQPRQIRPLGIDVFDDGETRRLFAVNDFAKTVEIYDIDDDGALIHRETAKHDALTSPNEVLAVGPDAFYVSNDMQGGREGLMADLKFLARAGEGAIFYYQRGEMRRVADKLRFANGMALSADGATLFAAETSGERLRVFARDRRTGALRARARIELAGAPDNLSTAENGAIIAAVLPKPLSTPALAADASATAPSRIVAIDADGAARTLFEDDGARYSAATVGVLIDDRLVLGGLYEEKLLICRL